MDSLTQFTLGAAVAATCLGTKLGPRKAALIGGVLGTIPDLDVFLPFEGPVDEFVFHRGWTHSLFVHMAVAPIIGEIMVRSIEKLREARVQVWLTVFLCFSTHAIIDAITVYGTRIFWPVHPDPIGVGSMFIIDPTYTIPLLLVVLWAFIKRTWSNGLKTGLWTALSFSTAYIFLSFGLQAYVGQKAEAIFAKAGIEPRATLVIAAPFNTILWKVVGREDGHYHNLYLSLFDKEENAKLYTHPSGAHLAGCLEGNDAFEKLKWFSRGHYRLEMLDEKIIFSDLRMGLTPNYAFRFVIAERDGETIKTVLPERFRNGPRMGARDFDWLQTRLVGEPAVRAAEVTQTNTTDIEACH